MYIYACNKINMKKTYEFKIEHRRGFGVWKGRRNVVISVFLYKNLRFVNWQKKGRKRKMSTRKPYSLIILRFKK